MDRFDREPFVYHSGRFEGRTYLDVAREVYTAQVRQERLKDMPTGVRDAGNRQPVGADGSTGPGT